MFEREYEACSSKSETHLSESDDRSRESEDRYRDTEAHPKAGSPWKC